MSYRLEILEPAKRDIESLPDRETQIGALRTAVALRDNPLLGKQLRTRSRVGDLRSCRAISFDRFDWAEKPRFRLVYCNRPDDGVIEVVQVVAAPLRERLDAYRAAAARLRDEARRRLEDG